MSTPVALLITLILLLGNAFFVAAEFAITSSRRSQLEPLAQAGDAKATTALWALEHVSRMLATAQLGVTVCSIGLGAVAEPAIAHVLQPGLEKIQIGSGGAHALALVIALVLVVYCHVVIGEMVPKNISISSPETAVRLLAPPLVWCSRVLNPIVTALNGLANWVLHGLGVQTKDEVSAAFNAAEVASIVERSTAEGVLDDENGLLSGALEFSQETAASVMVKRADLFTLPQGCTPQTVERAVATTGYSRFPLVSEEIDADGFPIVTGYLHLKDVLYADDRERLQAIPAWRTRALVPLKPTDEVEDALLAMQRTGAHLGRVEDSRGVLLGVLFLEDVLEELVGEVNDAMQRESYQRRV